MPGYDEGKSKLLTGILSEVRVMIFLLEELEKELTNLPIDYMSAGKKLISVENTADNAYRDLVNHSKKRPMPKPVPPTKPPLQVSVEDYDPHF